MQLSEINLTDPAFWSRPLEERHAAFATLRREDPIPFYEEPDPMMPGMERGPGYFALTRYADIVEASRKPEIYCSGKGSTAVADLLPEQAEFFGSFIVMDDPRHARLRGIVSKRFTPRQLAKVLDGVSAVADEVIDTIAEKGEVDLVQEVSAPFPLLIICDMMGIPRSEFDTVYQATNAILGAGDPDMVGGKDPLVAGIEGAMNLVELMRQLGDHKRANPGDDLTTALVQSDVDGEVLTEQELGSFFILLAVAGNDTTRTAISHGVTYLSQFPDQKKIWQDDVEGVTPTAVEEIVRYASPVTYMRRTLTRDAVLGGKQLHEGNKVVMFYGSGNRDETVFADPDAFDVKRADNPHIGFGGPGPHFCLGAHLARRELAVMFSKLLTRLPDLEATEPPHLLDGLGLPLVSGIKSLKVQFTPKPKVGV